MWKYVTVFLFLTGYIPAFSQRLTLEPGLGLGSNYYSVSSARNSQSRIMGFAGIYYSLDKKWSAGLSTYTADNFIKSVGGYPFQDRYDADTKTITLDPRNIISNSVFASLRYTHFITDEVKVFGTLGMGMITAVRKYPINSVASVKRRSFAVQPEVGLMLGKFNLSVLYQWGTRTPALNTVDPDSQDNVRMESIRGATVMLTASYRFTLVK